MNAVLASLAGAVALLLPLAAPAAAQEEDRPPREAGLAVAVAGGWYGLGGGDFARVGGGAGGETTLGYRWADGISVAVGGRVSSQGTDGLGEDLDLLSAFGEARYAFRTGVALRPFAGVRLGWTRWTAVEAEEGLRATARASGLELAALGGVAYSLAPGFSVRAAALLGRVSFGDATLDATLDDAPPVSGLRVEDSGSSGTLFGVQAGVELVIPLW